MPFRPTNTAVVPPRGWTVDIPDAGPTIVSNNWSEFWSQVGLRLRTNGLDRHGWREWVMDLMCQQRPDIPCVDDSLPSRDATGDDVRRFVRTIYETWKSGAQAVSDGEQDRRASICQTCPRRGYVSCLGGCGALAGALSEMTIGSKAKSRPELNKSACLVCACEISSLIMWPLDVLKAVDEKIGFEVGQYDPKCWKIQEPQA